MLCKKPFVRGMQAYGCGQCMHCRFNKRRVWTHRLMLEAVMHPAASFLTLTYNDDNLPPGGTLEPRDLQLWLKRFRKYRSFRFFAVGEYGDVSERPHYHAVIFGHGPECRSDAEKTWPYGFVDSRHLTRELAQYICGYVVKKLTRKDEPYLAGRYPEFARMSLRPGIGAYSMASVAETLQTKVGWDEITRTGDVPSQLRHGPKNYPLGRYLRRKLRAALSFKEVGQSEEERQRMEREMLVMFNDYLRAETGALGVKDMLNRKFAQKRLRVETRAKIFASKKVLI